jgi:hypothetical protein
MWLTLNSHGPHLLSQRFRADSSSIEEELGAFA